MKDKECVKVGKNVQAIRMSCRLNTGDFADLLHISESLLTKIECGDRRIREDTLLMLSKLTMLPRRMILEGTPEDFKDLTFEMDKDDYPFFEEGIKEFSLLLIKAEAPFISSNKESVVGIPQYQEAFDLINRRIIPLEFSGSEIADVINKLEYCYDKTHEASIAVSILSAFFYYWILYCGAQGISPKQKFNGHSLIEAMDHLTSGINYDLVSQRKQEYLQKYNGTLTKYMRIVEKDPEYSSFAYYFLALRYITGIMDEKKTGLTEQQEKLFGESLMECLSIMENKYALALANFDFDGFEESNDLHTV